ncbi:MAG: exodeoxyribonuclease VII large subunit [Candidatus Latescibacteria bacterium]|nr:exodeoxyribonuclease VII large subunit [Candidatus Latescibacterota bacterium]
MDIYNKRFTVSELTNIIKNLIEEGIPSVKIEGELSNYIHHSSGHHYFTLKDANSQIKCVMFKWQAGHLDFIPEDGMKLEAQGKVTVYERGGQYQFNVSRLLPLGRGELLARIEELKKKLAADGLFDNERPLPLYPSVIGVVTSPTGAAVRDIISVLRRRAPHVKIILQPVLVQGEGAGADIARGIYNINEFTDADVMIVGRGGGSIEDMWCFNEEIVARAIAGSKIPVVSAVGHEIDFTIADFAADKRAPTPSVAAEIVVRDAFEVRQEILNNVYRMRQAVISRVEDMKARVEYVRRGLSPGRFLDGLLMKSQVIDEYTLRMKNALIIGLSQREMRLERMKSAIAALNPRAVLDRGYAIAYRKKDNHILTDRLMVASGDGITVELSRGRINATVE